LDIKYIFKLSYNTTIYYNQIIFLISFDPILEHLFQEEILHEKNPALCFLIDRHFIRFLRAKTYQGGYYN